MRLGILIYSLNGGGAERVVSYLVSYCIKNNIDVHLILMNTGIKYDIPDSTKIYYIEKSNASESGIIKALKIPFLAYKYAKLVKRLQLTHSLSFLTRPSFINVLSRNFYSVIHRVYIRYIQCIININIYTIFLFRSLSYYNLLWVINEFFFLSSVALM